MPNDKIIVSDFLKNLEEKNILRDVNFKLPDIATQPEKIYRNYIKAGLQPDKYQKKEQLFESIKNVLNTEKVNGKQISMGQAMKKLFPDGYEGIPLTYSKSGTSKKGNRVINEVMFDKRGFREMIPLELKKWFTLQESKGLIPKGSLENYSKYISKGNERNRKIAARLSKLTGIKFDKGHIFALFSKHGQGGSHDPASQIAELLTENRGKSLDNITGDIGSIIDTPPNWQQSAFEWLNRNTGGKSGSGLPVDEFGKSLSQSDIADISRRGADPNQVVASRWKKVHDALSEAEIAKANNTIPEFVNKFSKRIDPTTGEYIQSFGTGKPKVKPKIVNIVRNSLIASSASNVAASIFNPASAQAWGDINRDGFNKDRVERFAKGIGEDLIWGNVFSTTLKGGGKAVTPILKPVLSALPGAVNGFATTVGAPVVTGGLLLAGAKGILDGYLTGLTGSDSNEIGRRAEEEKQQLLKENGGNGTSLRKYYRNGNGTANEKLAKHRHLNGLEDT